MQLASNTMLWTISCKQQKKLVTCHGDARKSSSPSKMFKCIPPHKFYCKVGDTYNCHFSRFLEPREAQERNAVSDCRKTIPFIQGVLQLNSSAPQFPRVLWNTSKSKWPWALHSLFNARKSISPRWICYTKFRQYKQNHSQPFQSNEKRVKHWNIRPYFSPLKFRHPNNKMCINI